MEELKAKNIIENLESIAAEKGADALTGEIIEECCRTNDADPEDFKNFICERIDIQELKKLSSESLDQVAGGARPVKQGMASFLAATSLLGSAANFTVSAGNDAPANAKRDIHTAQLIDLQKSVEQKNRRNKKKQSAWTGWDTLKYMVLGSFATCALAIAYWAHSQKNSKAPQGGTSKEGIYSPVERNVEYNASNGEIYAQFSKLLDEFEHRDINEFSCTMLDLQRAFPNASDLVYNSTYKDSEGQLIVKSAAEIDSYYIDDVIREIGKDNTKRLLKKLKDAHKQYLKYLDEKSSDSSSRGRGFAQAGLESSSSSSSQQHQPGGSKRVRGEVPEQSPLSDGSSAVTSGVGYSEYKYSPVELYWRKLDDEGRKGNRKRLEENVDSGIKRFRQLSPKYKYLKYSYDASEFFSAELKSKYTKKGYTPERIDAAQKNWN